jgi:hypothetical protein
MEQEYGADAWRRIMEQAEARRK